MDSFEFLDASNILKNAGIPFTGDELYPGEIRTGKRDQAPYVWAILVPAEKREESLQLLDEKISGEPYMVPQAEVVLMNPKMAWLHLALAVAIAIFIAIVIWKL